MVDLNFYQGKRVFITGHTGFKGSWMCRALADAGAEVTGYALSPDPYQNLFSISGLQGEIRSVTGDIRDMVSLKKAFDEANPEIVFHLAAQPIVRTSYERPVYTYETNVMGTINLLECIRTSDGNVKSVVNVTTDKVYMNREWEWGYRENEPLDGYDPYSNSKSCSELATHSYVKSFLTHMGVAVSTARAGNVIGGGDFARDRIIPDCVRAALQGKTIQIRNPYSIRPYQHVLEPIMAYLMIAQRQYLNPSLQGAYNVGPDECDCVTTGMLATAFCEAWGEVQWKNCAEKDAPHEANFLKLDCSKLKNAFGWSPRWHIEDAVHRTVEWYRTWEKQGDIVQLMNMQISEYLK